MEPAADRIIAGLVDGRLRELTFPITRDVTVHRIMISDSDGLRIYRRALSFLLIVAAHELFPDRRITIDHSLPFGGYYCAVVDDRPFSEQDLAQIEERMWEIVAKDEPIKRMTVPLEEAEAYFEERGEDDKVRLLKSRAKDYLTLYELRGVRDYFYGYMVPRTGYLTLFKLSDEPAGGFILHYPRRRAPDRLLPVADLPKLRAVFREQAEWLRLLGVEDIGGLNGAIREGQLRELILVHEALHEGRVADMADAIVARQPEVQLVLLSGPTSSGKTTTSKRLAIQLLAHGLKPYTLALDNYFKNREDTPRDEHGEYDFEHIGTVDLDLFNEQLLSLMAGEEVQVPHFDFIKGEKVPGETVQLTPEHIIIVEGIHGLNPELIREIPPEKAFRIYVSCLTQLNIDRHNRVPTTDVRLLRRLVRDAAHRGYDAYATLSRWPSVRRGEYRWVFPYQEKADLIFNSSLVYELAVLRPMAEPLLRQVVHSSPYYMEAKRLLSFLGWVNPVLDHELIPANSLLREFVGGSVLRDYLPGQPDESTEEAASH